MVEVPRPGWGHLYTEDENDEVTNFLYNTAVWVAASGWLLGAQGITVGDSSAATIADTTLYKAFTSLMFVWSRFNFNTPLLADVLSLQV